MLVLFLSCQKPFFHDLTLGRTDRLGYPSEGATAKVNGTTPPAINIVLTNYEAVDFTIVCVKSKQTALRCYHRSMYTGADIEFSQHVLDMNFDSGFSNAMLSCNLLVAGTLRNTTQNIALAG